MSKAKATKTLPPLSANPGMARPGETREETRFYDHVAYCPRCKITVSPVEPRVKLCAKAEELEFAATLSLIGRRRAGGALCFAKTDDNTHGKAKE